MLSTQQQTLTLDPRDSSGNLATVTSPVWSVNNASLLDLVSSGQTCVARAKGQTGTARVTCTAVNSSGNTISGYVDLVIADNASGPAVTLNIIASPPEDIPWWAFTSSDNVAYGGLALSLHQNNTSLNGGVAGRTFISTVITERIRQDGRLRQVRLLVAQAGAGWKIKVFRPSGATFAFVAESSTFAGVAGSQTVAVDLACQAGDLLAVFVPAGSAIAGRSGAGTCAWANGDIVTSNAFTDGTAIFYLCATAEGMPPAIVGTGDSIAEGHPNYHSWLHSGPAGDRNNEIWRQIQLLGDSDFHYQNHGLGSSTFSFVNVTAMPNIAAVKPKAIVVQSGVNDVSQGRTWAQIEADLNGIKAQLPAGARLFINEIMPSTFFSDVLAATVRTRNSELAVWCAANNATLVASHDAMGVVRTSTGQIDNLVPAYGVDGLHLSTAGAAALAAIVKSALDNYFG